MIEDTENNKEVQGEVGAAPAEAASAGASRQKDRRPLFPTGRRDGVGAILRTEEDQTQITALEYGPETVHFLAVELQVNDPKPYERAPHVVRFVFRWTAENQGDGSCCAVFFDWERMENVKHLPYWLIPRLSERELRWLLQFEVCPARKAVQA